MNKSSALSMRDWQRIAATMLIKGLRLSLTFRAEPALERTIQRSPVVEFGHRVQPG
jgi:hypothetical protein